MLNGSTRRQQEPLWDLQQPLSLSDLRCRLQTPALLLEVCQLDLHAISRSSLSVYPLCCRRYLEQHVVQSQVLTKCIMVSSGNTKSLGTEMKVFRERSLTFCSGKPSFCNHDTRPGSKGGCLQAASSCHDRPSIVLGSSSCTV